MFDQLSDRLQSTLSDVRSRGKLSEADIDPAMRDIRLALLEADVNFKVVKAFTKTLKERCLGAEVMDIRGFCAMTVLSRFESSYPEAAIGFITRRSSSMLWAPRNDSSVLGKCEPMSPSAAAPSRASITA